MDILAQVQYDAPIEHELELPNGKATGVVFKLVSANSPASKKIMLQNQARLMASNIGKSREKTEAEYLKLLEKQVDKTVEQVAACVVGWDWNGNSAGKIGKDPAFTPENVKYVLEADWIFEQVSEVVGEIENFTKG